MHAAYMDLSTKLLQRIETAKPPTNQEERTANKKQARQAARSVLPNATETKITVTMNARSIRNFLEQRASKFAEPEIRKLANKVYRIMQQAAPGLFSDYTETPLEDGTFALTTNNRKV
jgi:thymidylate synthase (FAD)